MSTKATQMRVGHIILKDGDLFRVESVNHITPGKGRAHVQTLLRNLRNGSGYEHRFRAEDFVDRAVLEQVEMEYLYQDGDNHIFMNTRTYEQIPLPAALLTEALKYILPNNVVKVEMHEGMPVGVELPLSVQLRVTETAPALKGATAAGSAKPATLETGLSINVPQFVETGDVVEIDTRSGAYLTRV
ncbi:MAG: elongation factor P [Acidobacteriota bacterium]